MSESRERGSRARVVAVLGMHRSGTSWLAGSLEERGLALGEVNEQAPYNEKGNRENDRIQALHDAVLHESGGSWREPPKRIVWSEAHAKELAGIIADMDALAGGWGFKDPRSALLLDEWKRQVGSRLSLVAIFRHPNAVAKSLLARDFSPVPERDSHRLWQMYNERIVAEHRRSPFPVLRFDVQPGVLMRSLDEVAQSLGLHKGAPPTEFFDPRLVRNAVDDGEDVPRRCRKAWVYLLDHAITVDG
jgi:hypothetical protein